jgi:hypothetical protein
VSFPFSSFLKFNCVNIFDSVKLRCTRSVLKSIQSMAAE